MIKTTCAMVHCNPRQETEYGMAGILHWQHPSGPEVHCLIRLTHISGSPIVILSELRSSPENLSFLTRVEPAANAAFQVIQARIAKPEDILWLTHAGPFSTFDTLWTPDIEGFSRIHLTWNGQAFEGKPDYSHIESLPLNDPFPKSLNLQPIETVLQQLQWTNWRDD